MIGNKKRFNKKFFSHLSDLSNPIAVKVWTDTDGAHMVMNCANGPEIYYTKYIINLKTDCFSGHIFRLK